MVRVGASPQPVGSPTQRAVLAAGIEELDRPQHLW
jgi:hypothetical protein